MLIDLIIIFLIFALIVPCLIFLMTPFFVKVPFVPVRGKVLNDIVSALELSDESVLYDLGCGDARVLFAAAKSNSKISCVGIEKAPFPYFWAKSKKFFLKDKQVKILNGDMFQLDTSGATHVFLYLFPKFMDSLLPKLEKELRPGSRVVSCDFEFSGRKPDQILNLKATKNQLNKKLLVYNF